LAEDIRDFYLASDPTQKSMKDVSLEYYRAAENLKAIENDVVTWHEREKEGEGEGGRRREGEGGKERSFSRGISRMVIFLTFLLLFLFLYRSLCL
jgi:hypothetical protein